MSIEGRRLALALKRLVQQDDLRRDDDLDELEHALDAYANQIAMGFGVAMRDLFEALIKEAALETEREREV